MASITIRNLDDEIKKKLRLRAAEHGRSMEEEVRYILRNALGTKVPRNLYEAIRRRIDPLGGVELDIPARCDLSEPPDLDE